jgi:ADP-ribosylglycohydrolase
MSIEKIKETYGFVRDLKSTTQKDRIFRWPFSPFPTLKKYYEFPAGSTEDGIERQKLIADAIIRKKERITVRDLAKSWQKNIKENHFGYALHYSDKICFDMVQGGIPPGYIGLFSIWPSIVSLARSCHPIGIINAGDPKQAAEDIYNVGSIYLPVQGGGIQTAAVVAAAIAEALKPNSSVENVIETSLSFLSEPIREEFDQVMEIARNASDMTSMRQQINDRFIELYGQQKSSGEEVVSRGLAIFYRTQGDVKDAILQGVNFGRDTDCTAAVAAGIAGAYSGADKIPQEWIQTVDEATKKNRNITVCTRTLAQTAQGLFDALQNSLENKKRQWDMFHQ